METFLLDWGLSHTMSKIIPYVLVILFGLLLAILVHRRFKNEKRIAITLSLFFLITPFIGYFAVNTIYQGDFSDQGITISIKNQKTQMMRNGLLVLALPGCGYCMESIEELKIMKKRKPKLKIEFDVIGLFAEEAIGKYEKVIDGKFNVKPLKNDIEFTNVTGTSYPTFIMIENGKAVKFWTNNQFGVVAKDKVENWGRD
ncbi:MAG: hypothetical protein P8M61_01065 [Crocinitomicaceae bacterium]|nr:hypothetical protein [Crocinitomicaceae bacterium]